MSFHKVVVGLIGTGLLALTCGLIGPFGGSAAVAQTIDGYESSYTFAGEGLRLTARCGDDQVHIVFSDGQEVVLPRAVSASGARYTDGDTLFWNKGDEATVEWHGVTHHVRVVDPTVDVWEGARRAGVDFRAVGQEPGWLLEVRKGESLHLALDYGATQITTPMSGLHIDYGSGARIFEATPPLSPLHITVSVDRRPCYDAMSGEGFTSAVAVKLGDSDVTYVGCGRDL